jgi:uncharacterized protein
MSAQFQPNYQNQSNIGVAAPINGGVSQQPAVASSPPATNKNAGFNLSWLSNSKNIKLLAIVFLCSVIYLILRPKGVRSVSLVGVGAKNIVADQAQLVFTLSSEGKTKIQTLAAGEQDFNSALAVVQAYNPSEINNAPFQLLPRQNLSVAGNLSGNQYVYIRGAQITLNDISKVDALIKELYTMETTVTSPIYLTQEKEQVEEETMKLAVKDAREKAKELAKASGARVGKVISIMEQGSNSETGSTIMASQTMGEQTEGSGHEEIEVKSVVTVVFELKNGIWPF